MAMNETDDFLAHYGIKGMKWGVRRSQAQLDSASNSTSRKQARRNASVEKKAAKKKKKAARIGARGAIGYDLGSKFNIHTLEGKVRTGATAAGLFFATPAAERYLGYELSKSAGYSTGTSAVIGLLGGTVGGLAASEISVRRKTRA